mgnify:CR=1 FL=1
MGNRSNSAQSDLDALSFEAAVGELEQVVMRLEQGEQPLAQALADFERGIALTRHCQGALEHAELRVKALVEDPDTGEERLAPFEADRGEGAGNEG